MKRNIHKIGKELFITSDEKIKNGDYILEIIDNSFWTIQIQANTDLSKYKKIILTTNQDLIKDGVQAIPDEFLKWFVKNPSCEEVETKVKFIQTPDNLKDGFYYEIIIPKEEPKKNFYCGDEVDYDDGKCVEQCNNCKDATGVYYGYLPEDSKQNIIDMMKGDEEFGMYDEILPQQIWNKEKMEGIKQLIQDKKKETLEEAAIKYSTDMSGTYYEELDISFKEGAKWQMERSYSEEEVLDILDKRLLSIGIKIRERKYTKEWFEQFKNK